MNDFNKFFLLTKKFILKNLISEFYLFYLYYHALLSILSNF